MSIGHAIVAGMPRSATTYLYFVAQQHPQVFLPYLKESNFFITNQARGVDWYWSLFKDATPEQLTLDISPATFVDPAADMRIDETCPEAKIIVIVRDPIEWCLSFYSQFKSFDYSTPDFATFADGHVYRHGVGEVNIVFKDNFVPSRIQSMMRQFGDRLLLISYRLVRDSTIDALRMIEAFLGIDPYFSAADVPKARINASGRRNVRWISRILSSDWLISGVDKLGVTGLARSVRARFDQASAAELQPKTSLYTPEELALNETLFAEQQAWVDDFFHANLAFLGTGEAVPATSLGQRDAL